MTKKKKIKKVVKKVKLESVIRKIDNCGYEMLYCPHCKGWDDRMLSGDNPITVDCNAGGEGCGKTFSFTPPTFEEKLLMLERRHEDEKNKGDDQRSKIWDLESKIRQLENTPWMRAKKKYDEYRKKPRKIWKDFLNSDIYLVPRTRFRQKLYKISIADVRDEAAGRLVGRSYFRIQILCTPNYIGKKLGYKEFKEGYIRAQGAWGEKDWQRLPNLVNPPLSKEIKKYLSKALKSHKERNKLKSEGVI